MGNGYHHHHQFYHQNFYSKHSFLPILCRVSIKDVKLKDPSPSFSDDPSSPKVSCMGQVKRNSKLIGFPAPYRLPSSTTAASSSRNNPPNLKYTKLKRFFSGRKLPSSSNSAAVASCGSGRGIGRNGSKRSSKINHDDGNQGDGGVNISELDPPLPVVKKAQAERESNLWKRRSGGMTLKSLQIHELPKNNYLTAPTV